MSEADQRPTGPSFGEVVLGTVLGNIGCLIVYFVFALCLIALLAMSGPQIGNVFSRITNGLNGP